MQIRKNQFAGSVPHGVLAQVANPSRLISVGEIEARQSIPMSVVAAIKAISSNNTLAYLAAPADNGRALEAPDVDRRRRSRASIRAAGLADDERREHEFQVVEHRHRGFK